jgi:very-short-patch-repair endonuclease
MEVSAARWLSLASTHNAVPVIRELTLELAGGECYRNVEIHVRTEPAFTLPFVLRVDRLDPDGPRSFRNLDIRPNHQFLAEVTESFDGLLHIEAMVGQQRAATKSTTLKLLPPEQWEGLHDLPEMLAAYIQPNHPYVGHLLSRAAQSLQRIGVSGLSGYQQQSRELVGKQVAAIYAALREEHFSYINPPAHFHTSGQRIRLPDQINSERLATCLDLAVLFSACLEQAGLHPLILMNKGHAWVGCWLDEGFSTASPVDDDGQTLRKRQLIGELLPLEVTLLTQKSVLAAEAQRVGAEHLTNEADFEAAFDVRLARQSGIRPIPARVSGMFTIPLEAAAEPQDSVLLDGVILSPAETPTELDSEAEQPNQRLEQWKRKLLDLSLRNKLLNFKSTAKTLRLLGTGLSGLEDALASRKSFGFEPDPRFDRQTDSTTGKPLPKELLAERQHSHVSGSLDRGKLITLEENREKLETRLVDLFRAARTAEEEGGVSPLFLALGVFEWKEADSSKSANRAPILLIPVALERSSVRAGLTGIKMSSRDEDSRINPTLLEKLRRDFGIAFEIPDVAPADESGVDVDRILGMFRHLVVNRKGWEVKDEMWLGEFSFKKFLMWRDLQEREDALKANPLIRQMLDHPHTPIASQGEFPVARDLDRKTTAADVFTPLVADSSQLAAIQAAFEEKSFVLEGPPGTGKSQTIANLIANCMAHGKTVLFVSEKKAALEVVRKRLADLSLDAYCLEVHSDKARKTEVIDQLKASFSYSQPVVEEKWQEKGQVIGKIRQELNQYVGALHHQYPCGLSIFEATGWLCANSNSVEVTLPWGDPSESTQPPLNELRSVVTQFKPLLEQLGPLQSHPLARSKLTECTPAIERSAKQAEASVRKSLLVVNQVIEAVCGRLKIAYGDLSTQELNALADLSQLLLDLPKLPASLPAALGEPGASQGLRSMAQLLRQRQAPARTLATSYRSSLLACDVELLQRLHQDHLTAWWPKRWLKRRALSRILDGYAAAPSKRTAVEDYPQTLDSLRMVQATDRELAKLREVIAPYTDGAFRAPESDPVTADTCAQWLTAVKDNINKLGRLDSSRVRSLLSAIMSLLSAGTTDIAEGGPLTRELQCLVKEWAHFTGKLTELQNRLRIPDTGNIAAESPALLGNTNKWLDALQNALSADQLRYWAAWQRLRERSSAIGLMPLVNLCESEGPVRANPETVFESSVRRWLLEEGLSRSPPLRDFIGQSQDQLIRQFRKADTEYLDLASSAAAARVGERISHLSSDAATVKELSMLNKEINKKTRHYPLRKLFAGMPGLLPRLKPCMLMSPISIAQHLDPDFPPFDIVVFDEASQIPVWDAIGAIARARQAIIVGDPKQMPPTSFFARGDDDEEMDDANEDLESILDETMTVLPVLRLEWHYRSRYESLITFSNRRYYDGKLITFPSPITEDRAVSLHRVNGVYGKGTTRVNFAEAQAVVQFAVEHCRNNGDRKESLGIVTFNAQQQKLIEDLLDKARREDPGLELHFSKQKGHEEVFVKNLENVQGDERDVIIFSTTFGLDDIGKMSLNFGPINTANGPRRLNVALTRSRLAMHVFTSLRSELLDTSRTTSIGVRHLKEFLEYAENGISAIRHFAGERGDGADSPFEDSVADALRRKGWEIHHQIGCGGYRIDLGVVHPDAPGTYLAGVECDGASYHSGATARDRDRLRQHKLEELGWKLQRIWSTDWWRRPAFALDQLHENLLHLAAVKNEIGLVTA